MSVVLREHDDRVALLEHIGEVAEEVLDLGVDGAEGGERGDEVFDVLDLGVEEAAVGLLDGLVEVEVEREVVEVVVVEGAELAGGLGRLEPSGGSRGAVRGFCGRRRSCS